MGFGGVREKPITIPAFLLKGKEPTTHELFSFGYLSRRIS
jgi:hypothetical protein